jgi:succinate dehydrogenase/fumarate reductase flavoprotein subunit
MRKSGLTSRSVRDFVVHKEAPVTEDEVLLWAARAAPADTVRMLLRKCERDGDLMRREVQVGDKTVALFWAPAEAAEAGQREAPQENAGPKSDGAGVEEAIAALAGVEERYEREVKGHMDRLHLYNETKDAAQDILGRVATAEGTTVSALYPRYGLETAD